MTYPGPTTFPGVATFPGLADPVLPQPTQYTYEDAVAQLQTNGNTVRFSYERLNQYNSSLGFLSNVIVGGSVNYDYLANIKRTGQLNLLDVTDPALFDFVNDRIRPYMGVKMPDASWLDFPLGVFLLSTPTRHYDAGLVTRTCDIYDQTQVLIDSVPTNISLYGGYYLAAGTLYTDAISDLLVGAGIANASVTPSDLALPTDRIWKKPNPKITSKLINNDTVWQQGASVAQIIQDLLTAINYGSVWFDSYGAAQCNPYISPDQDNIDHIYATDSNSIIAPMVEQTLDWFSIPNVIVLAVSQPDRPILVSKFVNSDPNSPVSTVRRGRRVVKFDNSMDVATQAELDALAHQAAVSAANVYETLSYSTMPMPNHGERDGILFTHNGLGVSARYTEHKWGLTLSAGSMMTHEMRRVVNIDSSLFGDPDAA